MIEKIVVGMDGSEAAASALRWAKDEAALHGADLEALVAWDFLNQRHADGSEGFDPAYGESDARAALGAWVAAAVTDPAEAAAVGLRAVCDLPAPALLDAGETADLLVVGARGAGGFEGLLVGSVADRVTQLATRPVCVVRLRSPVRGGRVVVGFDGSARSLSALRWAAAEAAARDADLDVVHAWQLPQMTAPPVTAVVPDVAMMEEAGRSVLAAALDDPALAAGRVHPHLTSGSPGHALMEHAARASLVVVGSRGHGRVLGALLGSVSRQLLHHAPCPVVVI